MHKEPFEFVSNMKQKFPSRFKDSTVLEVGSLNINGTVRTFFENCEYMGIDVGDGPGVDRVIPIHELLIFEHFDVVISTEMLEHDKHWQASLNSMYKNLKPGGLLILTCAGPTRQEHGTTATSPQDAPFTNDWYYNISMDAFLDILPKELWSDCAIKYERNEADLLFYGIKRI